MIRIHSQSRYRLVLVLGILLIGTNVQAQGFIEEVLEGQSYQPRFGLHHQSESYGIDDSYTDFRAFVPLDLTGTPADLFAFDGRLLVDNNSQFGYNLGLVSRSYLESIDAVFGANVYVDQRDTGFFQYNQVGYGWEVLGKGWEARQNFYHPVGTDRNLIGTGVNTAGILGFEENFLLYGKDFFFEQALRGFDLEVGGDVPGTDEILAGLRPLRAYVGTYYYDNPDSGQHVAGISGRLNLQSSGLFDLNLFINHDEFFHTHTGFGLTVWMDGRTLSGEEPDIDRRIAERMLDTVQRKQNITTARVQHLNVPTPVTRNGTPLRFVHAVSGGANGDGTIENPLTDVGDVQTFSQPGDIVYLHAGSVFDGQNTLVLQNNQRLLGEGVPHRIQTDQFGKIALPRATGGMTSPIIQNSFTDAIMMADNNEISGFSVLAPNGNGITGSGITAFNINRMLVDGATDNGLNLSGINGAGSIVDSMFVNSTESNVMLAGTALGGMITGNQFDGSTNGAGFDLEVMTSSVLISMNTANGNNANGFDIDTDTTTGNFENNTANNNGEDGIQYDASTAFTANFTGNTANENGLDGIDLGAGDFTGNFSGNMANDNHPFGFFDVESGFDIDIAGTFTGEFTGNSANNNGGSAIFLSATHGFEIDIETFDGTFSGNTATANGGFGVFTGGNGFEVDITSVINGSVFTMNTADNNETNGLDFEIDSFAGSFVMNTSNGNGNDGVNWEGTTFDGSFSGNTSNNNGDEGYDLSITNVVNNSTFSMNTSNDNDDNGFQFDIDSFNGTLDGNIARRNEDDGFNWDGNNFVGSILNNIADENGDDGFDIGINTLGSLANPVLFSMNTSEDNDDHGFDMDGDLFVGTISGNSVLRNTTDDGMELDYDSLVARITGNTFHGNGNSGNEAGLHIIANNGGNTSTVLIEDNNFGTDGATENEVGLNVEVRRGTMNLHVLDNDFFSDDESVRIFAQSGGGPDGNVNLNLFDNAANDEYQLLRTGGATFDLGYETLSGPPVSTQVATNGNTTGGGAPSVLASPGINFIMSNTIPLPPVFP